MLGTSSLPLPPHPDVPETAQSSVVCPDSASALKTLVTSTGPFTVFIRTSPPSQLNERDAQCESHVAPAGLRYQRFPANAVGADVTTGAFVGTDDGAAFPHAQQFVSAPWPA